MNYIPFHVTLTLLAQLLKTKPSQISNKIIAQYFMNEKTKESNLHILFLSTFFPRKNLSGRIGLKNRAEI